MYKRQVIAKSLGFSIESRLSRLEIPIELGSISVNSLCFPSSHISAASSRLRLLAIRPQQASRVPIQVDEDDDSGGPGEPRGSPLDPFRLF